MEGDRQLAAWLVGQRAAIELGLRARLGDRMPSPASPEAEALRRLRSFAMLALARGGQDLPPSLEGLRVREGRVRPLLEAWVESVGALAGPDGDAVAERLTGVLARFCEALRSTPTAVRASGSARAGRRRAVSAAIDRVGDAFLAIDADSGAIADANPAAGALLGTTRDALLGRPVDVFVPPSTRDHWWTELEAISESGEVRRFHTALQDVAGRALPVEASVSRFATRSRTLALLLARPGAGSS